MGSQGSPQKYTAKALEAKKLVSEELRVFLPMSFTKHPFEVLKKITKNLRYMIYFNKL